MIQKHTFCLWNQFRGILFNDLMIETIHRCISCSRFIAYIQIMRLKNLINSLFQYHLIQKMCKVHMLLGHSCKTMDLFLNSPSLSFWAVEFLLNFNFMSAVNGCLESPQIVWKCKIWMRLNWDLGYITMRMLQLRLNYCFNIFMQFLLRMLDRIYIYKFIDI